MLDKSIDWISDRLANLKEKHLGIHILLFSIFAVPILALTLFSYINAVKGLTRIALERRESVASLSATVVSENLSHLEDLGVSFASRMVFRRLVSEGKWLEAVGLVENVLKDFPVVERIGLFNPAGTVMAYTGSDQSALGKDFSSRDYYKGVSRNWQPYVSEVFKATVAPYLNGIMVAAPIKADNGEVLGFLTMQIRLESLFNWVSEIKIGGTGFIYIVDQNNHLIVHPKFPPQREIVDFSDVSAVQKMRQEGGGIIIAFNQIENENRVTAFKSIPKYGWGVFAQEPVRSVFADRNRKLLTDGIVYGFFVLFCLLLYYVFIKLLHVANEHRRREKILLDSIGDGVATIDRFWNITLWNKSAEQITGWRREEVMNKPFRNFAKLIREYDRKENIAFIEEAIIYGRTSFLGDHTVLIAKDGKEIPVGDSAAPIFDSNGIITGVIIVFRDISMEKESGSLKSDFAYASHQLNTPVTKILWSLENVLNETDSRKIKEKAGIAYQSAKSIQKLNSQLYLISRIDQKVVIPKYENVRLTDLIGEITKDFQNICKKCQITFNIEPISPALGIKTDAKMLERILVEITENATYYNKPGGSINLKTNIQDNNIIFELSDNGIGIAEDQKALIFTKFFRGNNFDTTNIIGAGLGLFIAQNYIKQLGGKIWFSSEKDKGTTFFVSLPLS